jgi:hypothetical protein
LNPLLPMLLLITTLRAIIGVQLAATSSAAVHTLSAEPIRFVFERLGFLCRSLRSDLLLPHAGVSALHRQKFGVVAALGYFAFMQDQDLVTHGDCA